MSTRHVPSTKRTARVGTAKAADYHAFLESKIKLAEFNGLEIDFGEINPALQLVVRWALRGDAAVDLAKALSSSRDSPLRTA